MAGVWQAGTSFGSIVIVAGRGVARARFDQAHAATGDDGQARHASNNAGISTPAARSDLNAVQPLCPPAMLALRCSIER